MNLIYRDIWGKADKEADDEDIAETDDTAKDQTKLNMKVLNVDLRETFVKS